MMSSYPEHDLPDTLLSENYPLSPLTTLHTGGEAEFFAQPDTIPQLQSIIRAFRRAPVYVLGGGSNVVVPDGKIPGLTVSTHKLTFATWNDKYSAEIGSGFNLSSLVRINSLNNVGGLEFSAGIPGTIGGAIMGNAGAGGHGVCEFVDAVVAVDPSGELRTFRRGEFEYGYRRCSVSGVIIVSALMSWEKYSAWDYDSYREYAGKRKSQPMKYPSAGCTFKNPPGNSAGKLLDECGCKGLRVGGAEVSGIHANFIVNSGNASSSDVMELAEMCAKIVHERTGITLEPEIRTLSPCFIAQ